jgi:hypothetical protein
VILFCVPAGAQAVSPLPPEHVEEVPAASEANVPRELGSLEPAVPEIISGSTQPSIHRGLRNPFWPVGWWPSATTNGMGNYAGEGGVNPSPPDEVMKSVPDWAGATKRLKDLRVARAVSGQYYVVKGSQIVKEGETLSLEHQEFIYLWKVSAVNPKEGVKLEPLKVRPVVR